MHPSSQDERPLDMVAKAVQQIEQHLARIADHVDPTPPDIVGTSYIAERLGCTADYVGVMAREGTIPPSCIVLGTGNGKPWRFYRTHINQWIEQR